MKITKPFRKKDVMAKGLTIQISREMDELIRNAAAKQRVSVIHIIREALDVAMPTIRKWCK